MEGMSVLPSLHSHIPPSFAEPLLANSRPHLVSRLAAFLYGENAEKKQRKKKPKAPLVVSVGF